MSDKHYATLGLAPGTPFPAVRARYIELARSCHPDKLSHLSDEEKRVKEEYFKEVTVAYHCIENGKNSGGDAKQEWDLDWTAIFNSFIANREVLDLLRDIAVKAKKAADKAGAEPKLERHNIDVPVTLEEIHQNKEKKLRLFLAGVSEPVYIVINCGEAYPRAVKNVATEGKLHEICMCVCIKPHDIYIFDDMLGQRDLYSTVRITLAEYITGCVKTLPYLDSSVITVDIPAFFDVSSCITHAGYGLQGKGDIIIKVEIVMPTVDKWSCLSEPDRQNILNALNALDASG